MNYVHFVFVDLKCLHCIELNSESSKGNLIKTLLSSPERTGHLLLYSSYIAQLDRMHILFYPFHLFVAEERSLLRLVYIEHCSLTQT